jgi:hypothetical protein
MDKGWVQQPSIQPTRVRMVETPYLSLAHALLGGFGKEWACS